MASSSNPHMVIEVTQEGNAVQNAIIVPPEGEMNTATEGDFQEEGEENTIGKKFREWLSGLESEGPTPGEGSDEGGMIRRVLSSLLSNPEVGPYEPLAVCVGPYHRRKPHLQRNAGLKKSMASFFFQNKCAEIQRLGREVMEMVDTEGMKWYDADVGYAAMGREEFWKMMILDGGFILQFMSCCIDNWFNIGGVDMKLLDINRVQRDVFLLENQLPFKVLEALEGDRSALLRKFAYFVIHVCCVPIPKKFQQIDREMQNETGLLDCLHCHMSGTERGPEPKHLLHYLHMLRFNRADFDAIQNLEIPRYDYRSSKELKKAGIDFQPSPSWLYSVVRFSHRLLRVTAKLQLPEMYVNDLTKPILLNLAAYEMGARREDLGEASTMASSFICFMDKLIRDEEDEKELRSAGVLYNRLGEVQLLATLFNTMATNLVPDPKLYDARVYHQIKQYFDNHGWRIWLFKNLYRPYFRSPWSVPAFIAALVGLALSMVQSYYAARSSEKH